MSIKVGQCGCRQGFLSSFAVLFSKISFFFCVKFFLRWMLQQSELGTLIKRNLYTHTKKITNKHFRQIKLKKFFLFFVVVWFCCLLT